MKRSMTRLSIHIAGAGILGLWQALTLARAGHRVRLFERSAVPFVEGASRYAGAMLAPDCEAESAPDIVRDAGHQGLAAWRAAYPHLVGAGTLVVAPARDRADLVRFGRMTTGHVALDGDALAKAEPDLAGRFAEGLLFENEAHLDTLPALTFLIDAVRDAGAAVHLATPFQDAGETDCDVVIDCRGLAARAEFPDLRGVRGERLVIRSHDVRLTRPVRLMHPRHSLYVVPGGDRRYVIGATMIESEDAGPVTVRSALELLGAAYALHPGFGEAEILEASAGVRPAFPDNIPRAIVRDGGKRIFVNGAHRHGFLLAPVLASIVANYVSDGQTHDLIEIEM
ncbi:MAG: FAD-dependent oxidoreductase [Hyphomicrobium sp.]